MSISNLTCIATQPHFYIDNSLAYVAGKCLLKPLVDLICDESNLESQLNYLCKPGSHTFNSPVVGSRAKERMAISLKAKEEPILGVFENALKENIYLIPDECREIADKIADLEFSKYIDKYRYWGLNEENVFHWTSGDYFRDRVVIFDPKNRWDTWRVEAMAVSSNSRFAAINLIMQVEEITRGVSLWRAREFDNRLLPTLATVMHVDEAIKTCRTIELSSEIVHVKDSKVVAHLNVNGIWINVGKVANCYRLLAARFGSLAEAVLSPESISFLKTGVCEGLVVHNVEMVFRRILRSLENFALQSHFQNKACFDKANGFAWLEECSQNAIVCEASYQKLHGQDVDALLDSGSLDDCRSLKVAIIESHAKLALQGRLSKNSAYSPHLAYNCVVGYGCFPIGDLSLVNNLPSNQRANLASKEIAICPFSINKNVLVSGELADHFVSTTIFGKIPKDLTDLCLDLLIKK